MSNQDTRPSGVRSRLLITILMICALAFGTTSVAYAYNTWHYTYDGVNIRQCGYTSCVSNGLGYTGQYACGFFDEQGETINGNPWWLFHHNESTGVEGWSAEAFMQFDSFNTC
jgi:hypothetical protein